jgi:hypothetical protein
VWIPKLYISRTFVNVTMYPPGNNVIKKKRKRTILYTKSFALEFRRGLGLVLG